MDFQSSTELNLFSIGYYIAMHSVFNKDSKLVDLDSAMASADTVINQYHNFQMNYLRKKVWCEMKAQLSLLNDDLPEIKCF